MTKKSLEKEVIEDLKKSGFGSQMKATKIFLAKDWHTTGSQTYFDMDENKSREYDLNSHHPLQKFKDGSEEILARSFFSIVVDVKKNNKPWVIFKEIPQPLYEWRLYEGWTSLIFVDGLNKSKDKAELSTAMQTTGLAYKLGWLGNGIHESFKKPEQPSRWYSSIVSICKAGEDKLKNNSRGNHGYPYLFFVKPLIILDGILMASHIDEKGEINVERVNVAPLGFEFSSAKYQRGRYKIDIVCLEYLDKYLDMCGKRSKLIFETLLKYV